MIVWFDLCHIECGILADLPCSPCGNSKRSRVYLSPWKLRRMFSEVVRLNRAADGFGRHVHQQELGGPDPMRSESWPGVTGAQPSASADPLPSGTSRRLPFLCERGESESAPMRGAESRERRRKQQAGTAMSAV